MLTPPPAHGARQALAVYTVTAGVLMVSVGTLRFFAPQPRHSPYTRKSVRATYGLMIVLGVLLVGLALHWALYHR